MPLPIVQGKPKHPRPALAATGYSKGAHMPPQQALATSVANAYRAAAQRYQRKGDIVRAAKYARMAAAVTTHGLGA